MVVRPVPLIGAIVSKSKALNLPASPNQAMHVATQRATDRDGGKLIHIYQFRSRYFAFVDDVAYPVPSAIDALEVPLRAQQWLQREANTQAPRVHTMSHPDPADFTRHYLLDGLVAKNVLSFDLTWDSFREKVEQTLFYVDLTVEAPVWHRAFAEEWWGIKAELEAHR